MSLIALALAAGGVCGTFASAQTGTDEARRKLEASQRTLTEKDRRSGELQSELARLKEDEAQLRAQQMQTARAIQGSEARLSDIEQRSKELEAQADLVRGSLEQKKGSLSGLLAAMQRMGRNPPPVMITRRQDALDMVRSAKLIAASAPELAAQANALADQLNDFIRIGESIKQEADKQREELRRMTDAQTRLAALNDLRRQTLGDRNRELADVRRVMTDIRRESADLGELIARSDRELAERTRLGQYEKELAAQAARAKANPPEPAAPIVPEVAPKQVATVDIRPVAAQPVAPPVAPPSVQPNMPPAPVAQPVPAQPKPAQPASPPPAPSITLAPGDRMAMASPGRLQPAIPFADAKGRLPMPVQGRRVVNFGEKTQRGVPFQGIAIQTRHGAQVVSPADGWVLYAGEFRSYGQILIINAGGGHHILLANLSQIDAQQGQFVLAGEPVGTMAPVPKGVTPARSGDGNEGAPILYIEFKKDNRSIDPGPWLAEPGKKNAGLITPQVISPQFVPG